MFIVHESIGKVNHHSQQIMFFLVHINKQLPKKEGPHKVDLPFLNGDLFVLFLHKRLNVHNDANDICDDQQGGDPAGNGRKQVHVHQHL